MTLSIGQLTATVTVDTSGVTRGVATTQARMAGLGASMEAVGTRSTGFATKALKGLGLALGGLGLAKVGGDAVSMEANFSKSMALISASTGATGKDMDSMRALAMKLGADTAFSANDAADAMLELAKAGVSTKDIMGGALKGTLNLAAAGATDLGTASTIASNAMNTFGLRGKDMNKIAAALAGGANASSASVESLGQGLQQVGPSATNAGMSLQETVAALSAFDAAGVKGSDAGTSLKTMLTNLIPATKKQAEAMEAVGLYSDKTGSAFVNANGSFKSMAQVSQLLHTHLAKLTDAQKSQALAAIFGSDSSRAATVLMNQGAKGINKYIKATKDQSAMQKQANANMSGTAGALERMKGSIETAELAIGTALAPALQKGAALVGALASGVANLTTWLSKNKPVAIALGVAIGGLTALMTAYNAAMAIAAEGGMAAWLKQTRLFTSVTKVAEAAQWAMDAAMNANPIMLAVIAIAALIAAIVLVVTKTKWGQAAFHAAMAGIQNAAQAVGKFFTKTLPQFFTKAWNKVKSVVSGGASAVVGFVKGLPGKIGKGLATLAKVVTTPYRLAFKAALSIVKNLGGTVVSWIAGIPGKLLNLGGKFATAGKNLLQGFIDGMKNAAGIIKGIAGNVWNAVKGLLNGAIDKINAALEFRIDKGPIHIGINPPDIPHLRTGGRVGANSPGMAWIGDANEPETVLRDSQLKVLLREAVAAATPKTMQPAGRSGPLIGAVYQQPSESVDALAERLWFKTRTRG